MVKKFFAVLLAPLLVVAQIALAAAQALPGVGGLGGMRSSGDNSCLQGGNDIYTKILLHMDGSNGGVSFPDTNFGGSAHTWTGAPTPASSATTVATSPAPKFGTASMKTSFGQLQTPNSADFTLGSGNFTVDFWFNPNGNSAGGFKGLFGQADTSGTYPNTVSVEMYRDNANKLNTIIGVGGNAPSMVSTSTFVTAVWSHIALVRNGNVYSFYVNGVQEGTTTFAGAVNARTSVFAVGGIGGTVPQSDNMFFDEFRLSVGVARWTGNFTPPSAPYCP